LNGTNLAKKIGELLIVGFKGKEIPLSVKELIRNYHIGGIILFSRNIGTPKQILTLTNALQKEAKEAGYKHPLLICADQENGVVRRLYEGFSYFPGAMALGATGNPEKAYQIGLATGEELAALGINWNLAPVLDVNNNPENPVIGVRSFGEKPEMVAQFGKAAMKGMQDAGIATTLKHFPGHGDTNVDSHLDLPSIPHDMERLENVELRPFKECIDSAADTVMTAHIYFPAIEDESDVPATLSRKVITGLLREKLRFNGVVTTDCMEMNAISETIGTEKGGVAAVKAGADLIMVSHTLEKQEGTIKEIIYAVESGEIDEKVIDQAIERIHHLKEKYLNWDKVNLDEEQDVPSIVGSKQHEELAYEVYKESVTIVKNDGILPLLKNDEKILVIEPNNNVTMQVEDKKDVKLSLGDAICEFQPAATVHQLSGTLSEEEVDTLISKASQFTTVVIGTLTVKPDSLHIKLIEKLVESGKSIVVVAMRSPYDFSYLPEIPVYITTYETTYTALKIAAGAIFGKIQAKGKLPVTIGRF
jgi:beta-N-acetylhexosaminidase